QARARPVRPARGDPRRTRLRRDGDLELSSARARRDVHEAPLRAGAHPPLVETARPARPARGAEASPDAAPPGSAEAATPGKGPAQASPSGRSPTEAVPYRAS